MKIFITGATGFIGGHVCNELYKLGHDITALVRNPDKAITLPLGVEQLQGDLSIFKDQSLVLPEFDVVIHLAAVLTGNGNDDYLKPNYEAVVDLVDCLERQKHKPKRLVFTSSLAASGPSKPGTPLTETDPESPIEAYGCSKLKAEQYIQQSSIPSISFRPPMVIGPNDTAVLPLFKMIQSGIAVRPAGKPQEVSFIAVDDLVSAIVAMATEAPCDEQHQVYFVSHPTPTTNIQLINAIGKVVGKKPMILEVPKALLFASSKLLTGLAGKFTFQNPMDEKQYKLITAPAFVCCSGKLHKAIKWVAKHDLEETLGIAYKGYKEAGWL